MTFYERFEQASVRIVNQLWQNDYLGTDARNDALAEIQPALDIKKWAERLLLALALVFMAASILLFFAYNWAHIPPMVKMGGILTLIAALAGLNYYLLRQGKVFVANLILTLCAFMVGVFMAVFGQIYQTGADSYTLFLTWAIMILPWVIMTRFLPLWVLWLVVCNIAMFTWWDLRLAPWSLRTETLAIMVGLFHLIVYVAMLGAVKMGESWLDKKWVKLLLAIGIFVPFSIYIINAIAELRGSDFDIGFWLSLVIFVGIYLFEKFINKSLPEYSVGFFCATIIIIFTLCRLIFEASADFGALLLCGGVIVGVFYFAYKYYQYATRDFEETLL